MTNETALKPRFLCDVHIPPRLVKALKERGFEAAHVYELGFGTAPDEVIWSYAGEQNAIIVTKDNDFARIQASAPGPRVILVCLGNCSVRFLMDKFFDVLPSILDHFEAGAQLVELG